MEAIKIGDKVIVTDDILMVDEGYRTYSQPGRIVLKPGMIGTISDTLDGHVDMLAPYIDFPERPESACAVHLRYLALIPMIRCPICDNPFRVEDDYICSECRERYDRHR